MFSPAHHMTKLRAIYAIQLDINIGSCSDSLPFYQRTLQTINKMLRILTLACLLVFAASQDSQVNDDIWAAYKLKFQKAYGASEDMARRSIFEMALIKIQRHNLEADMGFHSYWQGLTQFTDWTLHEFTTKMNGYRAGIGSDAPLHEALSLGTEHLPKHVDWRTKGYVTHVKDQGDCGSCWAFSTTGSLEGQHFAKTKKLVSLSEQNLVDCSQAQGNEGCTGGIMRWAFDYIRINKGIDTEKCYPYKAEDLPCKFKKSCIGATVTGYKEIKHQDEKALQDAIAKVGPVSVAIDAGHESFKNYKRGVYDEPNCSPAAVDHGVLAVGYGIDSGKDYYIVKNSYGTGWGMKGYIWMSRNKDNQCGIATDACYPLV